MLGDLFVTYMNRTHTLSKYVSAADHKMYNKVTLTMSYTEKLNLQPTLRLKTPCRRSWSVLIAFASASTNDVANARSRHAQSPYWTTRPFGLSGLLPQNLSLWPGRASTIALFLLSFDSKVYMNRSSFHRWNYLQLFSNKTMLPPSI